MWRKEHCKGKNMIEAKIHNNSMLSLCDTGLLGKILVDGDTEIKVSESFYKGEHLTEKELEKQIKDAVNINAIGQESVDLLVKLKVVDKDNVRTVNNVPMALVFRV